MKKLYLIIVLLFIVGIKPIYAHTFDNTSRVYDYAQVLTEVQNTKLKEDVEKFIDKYNIDMVIVTVKYYKLDNLYDYINEFYNKNNFGIGNNKSGIIIAFDAKDSSVGIKTFGIDDNIYNKQEIDNMLDLINEKNSVYKKLSIFIKYSNKYINKNDYSSDNNFYTKINFALILTISILVPTILVIILLFKSKSKKQKIKENLYIKENLKINKKIDKFLTTHTNQI